LKYPEKAQLNADAEHNDGDHNEGGVVLHGTKIPESQTSMCCGTYLKALHDNKSIKMALTRQGSSAF
jgi:hypothetical protein